MYEGQFCEVEKDVCAINSPCLHGGTCLPSNATFRCICTGTGYQGDRCDLDIDECEGATHNCTSVAEPCVNLQGSFKCGCAPTDTGK